jgi:hypothetical protein
MRLAIVSDTHLGDPDSVLVEKRGRDFVPGRGYGAFKEAAGKGNDILVLAGDIIDFAITEYAEAYRCARCFFDAVKRDGIADVVLYLAGNHDADLWHIVQHQRHVIRRLGIEGKLPEPYAHSVPAIIDDRSTSRERSIVLHGVKRNPPSVSPHPYGKLFLDNISDPPTTFYFAFPNLYITSDRGTVLVTHGQYLEAYWSFLGSAVPLIAPEVIAPDASPPPSPEEALDMIDIESMTAMNYPLNQLSCTGVGQAGAVTRMARIVEKESVKKQFDHTRAYLDGVIDLGVQKLLRSSLIGWVTRSLLKRAKTKALANIAERPSARYDSIFFERESVRRRFYRYYAYCLREIARMKTESGVDLPPPTRVIFGHTHQPISMADEHLSVPCGERSRGSVVLHNTGGWLCTGGVFCGAEIFLYDSEKGFSSRSVVSRDGMSFSVG